MSGQLPDGGRLPDAGRPRPGPPAVRASGRVFDERGVTAQRARAHALGVAQREVVRLSSVLNALGTHAEVDLDLDLQRYARQLVRALRALDELHDLVDELGVLVRPPSTS